MSVTYQKVFRGRGSLSRIPQMMSKFSVSKPLIVGSGLLTGKLLKKVPSLLTAPVFDDYHPNPDFEDAVKGVGIFHTHQCDGIISIGGGSAIDTAKAIKALLFTESQKSALEGRFPEHMPIPHIALPATAGTGAEATQNAVIYVENRKASLSHPALRPDGVVLDADLLETLPLYHRKSSALDALCQGIESYWCTSATEDSRIHAYLAILGVLDNLKAYLAGDPHAAEEMLDASYQSGKAIQLTRTTAAHAMSYQLTKTMGYAHGHACMLTLPTLWEAAEKEEGMTNILTDLSRKMRLGNSQMVPKLLRGILIDLDMEIPSMPSEEILDMLSDSVNTERLSNHPVKMTSKDVKDIYKRAFIPIGDAEKLACLDIWKYYGV